MRMRRIAALGGVVLAIGVAAVAAREPATPPTAAQPITYAELGKLVRGHKGKVVVVDIWSVT